MVRDHRRAEGFGGDQAERLVAQRGHHNGERAPVQVVETLLREHPVNRTCGRSAAMRRNRRARPPSPAISRSSTACGEAASSFCHALDRLEAGVEEVGAGGPVGPSRGGFGGGTVGDHLDRTRDARRSCKAALVRLGQIRASRFGGERRSSEVRRHG